MILQKEFQDQRPQESEDSHEVPHRCSPFHTNHLRRQVW